MARSIKVGNIEITSITDGGAAMPPGDFFPGKDFAPYKEFLDADGNQPLRLGSFLIRDGSRTILVDTGLGERDNMFGMKGDIGGCLAGVGVTRDQIDTVLTTHMHFDHIGGHTVINEGKDVCAFPNATFPIRETEWQYWTQPEVMAENPSIGSCALPLAEQGRLQLVAANHAITPSITYIDTPGHTPGHVSVLVMSQGKGALIIGDVSHSPMQIPNPSWSMPFDTDGDQAAKTRAAVFDRIIQEGLTLCAGHYAAGEGIGTIVEVDGKRTWRGV
jgi:glyoxylase-like metal-dependent hydrolase (beta-lactamase superfamily II)